jgi:hypothetical protein
VAVRTYPDRRDVEARKSVEAGVESRVMVYEASVATVFSSTRVDSLYRIDLLLIISSNSGVGNTSFRSYWRGRRAGVIRCGPVGVVCRLVGA